MAIIALANLKGGVGKSTLAVNIAGALVPKSVLVDADGQATVAHQLLVPCSVRSVPTASTPPTSSPAPL